MTVAAPRFPWRLYGVLFVVILLFAAAPVISAFSAIGIAEANGCTLNESGSHPCIVFGNDLGELLVFMFVLGWLGLVTLPLGGGALIVWLVILVIHRIAFGRFTKAEGP